MTASPDNASPDALAQSAPTPDALADALELDAAQLRRKWSTLADNGIADDCEAAARVLREPSVEEVALRETWWMLTSIAGEGTDTQALDHVVRRMQDKYGNVEDWCRAARSRARGSGG